MKILVVEPHALLPGPAMYAEQFCDALAEEGRDVTLLTAAGLLTNHDENRRWRQLTAFPQKSSLVVGVGNCRFVLFKRFVTAWTQWFTAKMAFYMHRKNEYDAVHFLSSEPLTLSVLYLLAGAPDKVFVTNRGYEFGSNHARSDFLTRSYQLLRRAAWKIFAQKITVLAESACVKDALKSSRIIRRKDVHVVPHPAWSSSNGDTVARKDARRQIGIDYDGKLFLIFGHRPQTQKSPETVIEAIALLPKEFRIVIAGLEPDKQSDARLEQIIHNAGWDDDIYRHFRFIPNDQIQYYFTACDAVILSYTSNYIGSSGVLSLACEYQRPVIAADVGDLGATVAEYEIGLTFKTQDPQSLRDAVRRFLLLPQSSIKQFKKRMKQIHRERSWPNIANRHLAVYCGR